MEENFEIEKNKQIIKEKCEKLENLQANIDKAIEAEEKKLKDKLEGENKRAEEINIKERKLEEIKDSIKLFNTESLTLEDPIENAEEIKNISDNETKGKGFGGGITEGSDIDALHKARSLAKEEFEN